MLPQLRQYREFISADSAVHNLFIRKFPTSEPLFTDDPDYITDTPADYRPFFFFHEFAHCIDVVNRQQYSRLTLQNFGFANIFGKWSKSMLINELNVVAIQHLIETSIQFEYNDIGAAKILPLNPVILAKHMLTKLKSIDPYVEHNFEDICHQYSPYIDDMVSDTINHLITVSN